MARTKGVEMTSCERLLAALQREPVDYIPCCAAFNPLSAVQRRDRGWHFPWPQAASVAERTAYQVEELGLDQIVPAGADLCRPAPGVESRTWMDGQVLHQAYTTAAGELHASVNYNELWPHGEQIPLYSDFNIGHFVEPWIQTEQDLDCLKLVRHLSGSGAVRKAVGASVREARDLADRYGLPVNVSLGTGLTGAQQLFGAEALCLAMVDSPGLVDAYLEYEHGITMRTLEVLSELPVDMVRRNGFYETGDFYSPAMLEQFLGPRLRAEAAAAEAGGMHMSYTVHTGVMTILEYLATLGMGSMFGIDPVFKGTDLRALHEALTPVTGLWIGPSSTYHLWEGPEATRQAVRDVFEVFAEPGFVLSPCVSAHSIMPWESTLAMIDTWKELR